MTGREPETAIGDPACGSRAPEPPYHEGERVVQERAGVRDLAARIGRSVHREIPDRARAFLADLSMLVVGTVDPQGRPWVSPLVGPRGSIAAPVGGTLRIDARRHADDPAGRGLRAGAPIGALGIHFASRRRVRVNGTVRSVSSAGVVVDVEQAYANCPKYIRTRPDPLPGRDGGAGGPSRSAATLTEAQVEMVARADTFFIGTAAPGAGADASHRGGKSGFVRATPTELIWPDYRGNSMFNTLGNIQASGRAGLAFVDFDTGRVLQVTGTAAIDWNRRRASEFPDAERLVRLRVTRTVEIACRLAPARP